MGTNILSVLVIQMVLVPFLSATEYDFQIDSISGDLIKPSNMSDERFELAKFFRIKEILEGAIDKSSTSRPGGRRVKRAIGDTDSNLPSLLTQGFYKQEALVLNKFDQPSSSKTVKTGEYAGNKLNRYFKFKDAEFEFDIRFSVGADYVIKLFYDTSGDNSGTFQEIPTAFPGMDFSSFGLGQEDFKKSITDIVYGNNPQSDYHFVCVTVDSLAAKAAYPAAEADGIMNVNDPYVLPESGKSKLFVFKILNKSGSLTYVLTSEQVLDTYGARDAEFWTWDNQLFLGIAHTGNPQTQVTSTFNKIWYQPMLEVSEFLTLASFEGLGNYAAVMVQHHVLQSISYVFFTNSGPVEGSTTSYNYNRSPVYKYSYERKSYELVQTLPTFGAVSSAVMSIKDPYPLNNLHFLVYANKQETGEFSVVDDLPMTVRSVVYKLVKGKFIPFQELDGSAQEFTSVLTYFDDSTAGELNQAFVFHSNVRKITKVYQFDGRKFVFFNSYNNVASVVAHPLIWRNKLEFDLETVSLAFESDSLSYSNTFASKLKYCIDQRKNRLENRDMDQLFSQFQAFPTLDEFQNSETLVLEELTIGELTATKVSASVTKPTSVVEIAGLTTVDKDFAAEVSAIKTDLGNLKSGLDTMTNDMGSKSYLTCGVENTFSGDLIIKDLTATTLTGTKLYLGEDQYNLKSANGATVNVHTLEDEVVLIGGNNVAGTGVAFDKPVVAGDVKIAGDYRVTQLAGTPVADFAQITDATSLVVINGKTTFTGGAKFTTLDVENLDENALDVSNLLLRRTNQDFSEPAVFSGVHFTNIEADTMNGLDLTIMDQSVNYGDTLVFDKPLTVTKIEIDGNLEAKIGVTDAQGVVTEEINLKDLNDLTMKKTGDQVVKISHTYDTIVATKIVDNSATVNGKEWPEDFVGINTAAGHPDLTHSSSMTLGDVDIAKLSVGSKIVDRQDNEEISVETGVLDIALLGSLNTITNDKKFKEMHLFKDSDVTSKMVMGLNMDTLNGYVANGVIPFNEAKTLANFELTGEVKIEKLKSNGAIHSNCDESCVRNDLSTTYANGIRRDTATLPNIISEFSTAVFEDDVSVTTIDAVSPKDEYIRLEGSNARDLSGMVFKDEVYFAQDVLQTTGATINTCKAHLTNAPLCKLDSDGTCCNADDTSCQCEMSGELCVVKAGINQDSICETIVKNELTYVQDSSLKVTGPIVIGKTINFIGGFSADQLKVTTEDNCVINGVNCANIASTKHAETFTDDNEFGNTISSSEDITVQDSLTVAKQISTVDINDMYANTLLIDGEPTKLEHTITFDKAPTITKLVTNDADIGATPVSDLLDRTNHVLNAAGDTTVCSKLTFNENVDANKIDSDTIDGVDTANFFTNFWTKQEQTITGSITVSGNADFEDKVVGEFGISTFNKVDIKTLDRDAIRLAADFSLNDVQFTDLELKNERGLTVTNKFLGLDTNDIVLKKNDAEVVITGVKNFKNSVKATGDVTLSGNTWQNKDTSSSVNFDKFTSFQDDATFDKVEFQKDLTMTYEPTATTVNGEDLANLKDTKVFVNQANALDFDIKFNDVDIAAGGVVSTKDTFKINSKDLEYWKANYMSLSKENTVTEKHTFSAGMAVEGKLDAVRLVTTVGNTEYPVVTDGKSIKLFDMSGTALMRNTSYADITNELIVVSLVVNGNLVTDNVNGVDISNDALDYVTAKTMAVNTKFTGDLDAAAVTNDLLEFPLAGADQTFDGVVLSDGTLTVTPSKSDVNAVKKADTLVTFSASKSFSGTTTINDLTATNVQSVAIGDCDLSNILLTTSCNDKTQTITGALSFKSDVSASTNLVISDKIVNNVNLDTLAAKYVSKTDTGDIVIAGEKTIKELDIKSSTGVTLKDTVFGLNVDKLVEEALLTANMDYSDATVSNPDLVDVVEKISKTSTNMPSTFVYSSLQAIQGTPAQLFPVWSPFWSGNIHLIGLNDGKIEAYGISTNVYSTKSSLSPLISINTFTMQAGQEGIDLVSLPIGGGAKMVVISNMERSDTVAEFNADITTGQGAALSAIVLNSETDATKYSKHSLVGVVRSMTTIRLGGASCVVVVTSKVHVLCGMYLDSNQIIGDDDEYSSVTAYPTANDALSASETFLALTSPTGKITFMKATDGGQFLPMSEMAVQTGSLVRVAKFKDLFGLEILTVAALIAPNKKDGVVLAKLDRTTDKFEFFQQLDVEKPIDIQFYESNGDPHLRILHGEIHDSKLSKAKFLGQKFALSTSYLRLSGVNSFTEMCPSCGDNQNQMVVTRGDSKLQSFYNIPLNAVHRFMYKENRVDEYRTQYNNEVAPVPKFLSLNCHTMVAAYIKKLYDSNLVPVEGFNLENVGSMFLKLMPRSYIKYRPIDFSTSVKDVLSDAKFDELLAKSPPNGVANLYPYYGTEKRRTFGENDYAGSVLIYQEVDGVLYVFSRLKSDTAGTRAISFHTECKGGVPLSTAVFPPGGDYDPKVKMSGPALEQCSMYHNADSGLSSKLKDLDNKNVAGVVVVHAGATTDTDWVSCGYIKNPEQAKLQFLQDHDAASIEFEPFMNLLN